MSSDSPARRTCSSPAATDEAERIESEVAKRLGEELAETIEKLPEM